MALSTAPNLLLRVKKGGKMKKKTKILLAVLSAMVMLFGSCLTVFASNDGYNEDAVKACSSMMAYSKRQNLTQYQYKTFYGYSNGSKYLVYSDKPLLGVAGVMGYATIVAQIDTQFYVLSYINDSPNISLVNHVASSEQSIFSFAQDGTYMFSAYDVSCRYSNGTSVRWTAKEDFFPNPPVAEMAVPLGEMVQTQTKVILTMAVACLALLVILSVLPKKLPIFLNS